MNTFNLNYRQNLSTTNKDTFLILSLLLSSCFHISLMFLKSLQFGHESGTYNMKIIFPPFIFFFFF